MSARGQLSASSITKWFGQTAAVADASFDVGASEFFTIVGPTGSGKTTLLRLIAGLERLDGGAVRVDGEDISFLHPEQRPVHTVFQHPTLFPHRSVAENVGFGLRFQRKTAKLSRADRARRVNEALDLVRLSGAGRRRPAELSGGEQQLVALARALILRPKVLLLDEPLASVDSRMRRTLLPELRAVQQESSTTFIHVTHDHADALAISDRIGVMGAGQMLQVGSPRAVYERPASSFVADVLGLANLVPAFVMSPGLVEIAGMPCPADTGGTMGDCTVLVRPERVHVAEPGAWAGALRGWVTDVSFAGATTQLAVDLGACRLNATVANDGEGWVAAAGSEVDVVLPREALQLIS